MLTSVGYLNSHNINVTTLITKPVNHTEQSEQLIPIRSRATHSDKQSDNSVKTKTAVLVNITYDVAVEHNG